MKKFLCICARGNSRSVALGWILKDWLKQEAIAIGFEATSPETRQMLYDWADIIVLIDRRYASEIPESVRSKTTLWPIDGDPYFRCYSPELLNKFGEYIYQSGLAPLLVFQEGPNGTGCQVTDPEGKFTKVEVA